MQAFPLMQALWKQEEFLTRLKTNHTHGWATSGPYVYLFLLCARVVKCCFLTASFKQELSPSVLHGIVQKTLLV